MKTILLLLALLGASAASRLDHHTVGDAKIDPSLTMAVSREFLSYDNRRRAAYIIMAWPVHLRPFHLWISYRVLVYP